MNTPRNEVAIFKADYESSGKKFTRYIIVPSQEDYDKHWQEALRLALEFENTKDTFLLQKLTYNGMGDV